MLCASNLNAIGKKLTSAYTNEELANLLESSDAWAAILEDQRHRRSSEGFRIPESLSGGCPRAKNKPYLLNRNLRKSLEKGLPLDQIPLMWDTPGNHGDLVSVFFLDNCVRNLEIDEFIALRASAPS